MLKKILSLIFILTLCIISIFTFAKNYTPYIVTDIITPTKIVLNKKVIEYQDIKSFDSTFSEYNKQLAKQLNISETEAFIIGNLSKYWASNLLKGRIVYLSPQNDIIYLKHSYKTKFIYSGFCLKDNQPIYKSEFEKQIKNIRDTKYVVIDTDNGKIYNIDSPETRTLKHFLLIKKNYFTKINTKKTKPNKPLINTQKEFHQPKLIKDIGNIKILLADSTNKIKPDRNCTTSICREILTNINNTQNSIDIAIYGYSRTPEIEKALIKAKNRGVKIRLVYDIDSKGNNIYPNTQNLLQILTNNKNDGISNESGSIMHNKFYIFDDKILITGSANLSHTDMSGFNSNSIAIINSTEVVKLYKKEFEQMYLGNFHNKKSKIQKTNINISNSILSIYFSPKDKSITNVIVPLINNAKKYIYIPTFILTDKQVTLALINAKNRGVDIRIILDALNASVKHSKHDILRAQGILVKTENYAGKMHSKSIIIDDKYTIIGSMNFSYSGENKNDENLIVIQNPEIAIFYKQFFLYQWHKIDNKWLKQNARAESFDSIGSCSDGIDNDYDGKIDKLDEGCMK